jgi:hypothetical protein
MLAADCFEIGDRLDGVGRAAGDVEAHDHHGDRVLAGAFLHRFFNHDAFAPARDHFRLVSYPGAARRLFLGATESLPFAPRSRRNSVSCSPDVT